jgi:hypothetical protein
MTDNELEKAEAVFLAASVRDILSDVARLAESMRASIPSDPLPEDRHWMQQTRTLAALAYQAITAGVTR